MFSAVRTSEYHKRGDTILLLKDIFRSLLQGHMTRHIFEGELGGILRNRKTSSLDMLNHYCVRNA
jgi:hypothetical protein